MWCPLYRHNIITSLGVTVTRQTRAGTAILTFRVPSPPPPPLLARLSVVIYAHLIMQNRVHANWGYLVGETDLRNNFPLFFNGHVVLCGPEATRYHVEFRSVHCRGINDPPACLLRNTPRPLEKAGNHADYSNGYERRDTEYGDRRLTLTYNRLTATWVLVDLQWLLKRLFKFFLWTTVVISFLFSIKNICIYIFQNKMLKVHNSPLENF